MTFGSSFKNTAQVLYSITFENSNILETENKLKQLEFNVTNNISTGKHVGAQINIDDVKLVINTLKALKIHYEAIHKITNIPSQLKLYEMLKTIRDNERQDAKALAKDALSEILKPEKTAKKLTKKQNLTERAVKKSLERKMDIIKKLGK